jgi:heterotetrameric sarcosine oxidase delta subunit
MSFCLDCPECGPRPVGEFRSGGERREPVPEELPDAEWSSRLYARANLAAEHEEWWFHRLGCRRWFLARRDPRENRVLRTWRPEEEEPA